MPIDGPVPEQVLTLIAAATVFAVMFHLGLGFNRHRASGQRGSLPEGSDT